MQKEFEFSDRDDSQKRFSRLTDFFSQPEKPASAPVESPVPQAPESVCASDQLPMDTAGKDRKPMTVSQLNDMIKALLEVHAPPRFLVEGEVSNCKRHGSGHIYLTLKDERSGIAAVIWRSVASKLRFDIQDGQAVLAGGRLDYYSEQGKLQVIIDRIEPAGLGALELAFRQLADKLRREGLFDERHKKSLPRYPQTIAMITSDTGAAVRDIHQTLNRRFPAVRQLLFPVRVQGEGAAQEIAAAIQEVNRRHQQVGPVDVMIVGRGGGSIEDLWAFNEEVVARAIFASKIPVISAVGHEIDTTIADLVADVRAATPTAAAELAVPDRWELNRRLTDLSEGMTTAIQNRLEQLGDWLQGVQQRPMFARPIERVNQYAQTVDQRASLLAGAVQNRLNRARRQLDESAQALRQIEPTRRVGQMRSELSQRELRLSQATHRCIKAQSDRLAGRENRWARLDPRNRIEQHGKTLGQMEHRLGQMASHLLKMNRQQLVAIEQQLKSLDPKSVLKRGYSITRLAGSGQIIGDVAALKAGDRVLTELKEQQFFESEVVKEDIIK